MTVRYVEPSRWALVLCFSTPALLSAQTPPSDEYDLGEIIVIGARPDGMSSVGGSVITRDEAWTFGRMSLDQAVNLAPGVVSTFDANGRRNESDIFVRGFGRWQVPLLVDGVRIYLPADNRLDFGRFLTADVAAIHIQKGYASVIDGPGAMGGLINLVTTKPTKGSRPRPASRPAGEAVPKGRTGTSIVGTPPAALLCAGQRGYWIAIVEPVRTTTRRPPTRLQRSGERLSSDTRRLAGQPQGRLHADDDHEYTLNYIKQSGEKGAPLNIYNNPPVPPNSYWRWPYWDIQNLVVSIDDAARRSVVLESQGLLQHLQERPRRIRRHHLHDAVGRRAASSAHTTTMPTVPSLEFGTTPASANTLKAALHYRYDMPYRAADSTGRRIRP